LIIIKQIGVALQKAIKTYNNKSHKELYLMTPNQIEEALFHQNNKKNNKKFDHDHENNHENEHNIFPLLAQNVHLTKTYEIIKYKHPGIKNYVGDWQINLLKKKFTQ